MRSVTVRGLGHTDAPDGGPSGLSVVFGKWRRAGAGTSTNLVLHIAGRVRVTGAQRDVR